MVRRMDRKNLQFRVILAYQILKLGAAFAQNFPGGTCQAIDSMTLSMCGAKLRGWQRGMHKLELGSRRSLKCVRQVNKIHLDTAGIIMPKHAGSEGDTFDTVCRCRFQEEYSMSRLQTMLR